MAFLFSGTLNLLAQGGGVTLLPMESETTLRTKNPIGWTDGVAQRSSAGLRLNLGPLVAQVKPEWVYRRSDRRGDVLATLLSEAAGPNDPRVRTYIQQELNRIDAPVRFTDNPRQEWLLGESFVRMQGFGFALSASNESIFWGPGVRNSLILSGPRQGFRHAAFQTIKPIATPIGSIQGMVIAGRLDNSKQTASIPTDQASSYRAYIDKWRYISGFDASFAPSVIQGLSVGVSRTFVGYHTILDGWDDYFPMFQPLTKDNFVDAQNPTGDDEWDQQLSVYFSWSFDDADFRLFGEFGRNDHSADLRDLVTEPEHSRAYVVGAEKTSGRWHHVVEVTQLAMTKTQDLRASPIWYTHHIVRQGITHAGQILGPEIGPGSTSWYASSVLRLNQETKIGWSLERVQRQEDLYRRLFPSDAQRRWSDVSLGLNAAHRIGPLSFGAALITTKSINYAFQSESDPWDVGLRVNVNYNFSESP